MNQSFKMMTRMIKIITMNDQIAVVIGDLIHHILGDPVVIAEIVVEVGLVVDLEIKSSKR